MDNYNNRALDNLDKTEPLIYLALIVELELVKKFVTKCI